METRDKSIDALEWCAKITIALLLVVGLFYAFGVGMRAP